MIEIRLRIGILLEISCMPFPYLGCRFTSKLWPLWAILWSHLFHLSPDLWGFCYNLSVTQSTFHTQPHVTRKSVLGRSLRLSRGRSDRLTLSTHGRYVEGSDFTEASHGRVAAEGGEGTWAAV